MTSLQKDVSSALRIDDIDKPATSNLDAPTTSAAEVPVIDPPVTPTTPEMPGSETFTEASAHTATTEPLAITSEVETRPAAQETAPAAPDLLKDAKAS